MADTDGYYPSLVGDGKEWEQSSVVFVFVDGIAYGDLNYYGQNLVRTLTLDLFVGVS